LKVDCSLLFVGDNIFPAGFVLFGVFAMDTFDDEEEEEEEDWYIWRYLLF